MVNSLVLRMKLLAVSILLSILLFSCSEIGENLSQDDLEVISIDLSNAYDGKLSEFFEPEVDYIWLKDDSEEAQLGAGLNKIEFYGDKILILDVFGCKCVKIFDKKGNYLSQIRAYGDGPEKYLDLDNFMVHDNQILLLGVYPSKFMWFDFDGNFLKEEKLPFGVKGGVFMEKLNRFYFFSESFQVDDYLVRSVNSEFQDTTYFFPIVEGRYYGNYSERYNLIKNGEGLYYTMPFQDTIFQLQNEEFVPRLVFDYGSYAQDLEELKRNSEELNGLEEMEFINKRAKLYFVPYFWNVGEDFLFARFSYEEKNYSVFYDRNNRETAVLNFNIENDLDESGNNYFPYLRFGERKMGKRIPGVSLFESLMKKKEEFGEEAFESYINGKGKKFAEVATAAKDSENPVLIIYTLKK